MIEKKPTQDDMENLLDALAAALMDADEFFTARDEMNAKIHLSEARWSPITLQTRAAVKAWQTFRYPGIGTPVVPELIDGSGAGESMEP